MSDEELNSIIKYVVKKHAQGDQNVLKDASYCISKGFTRAESIAHLKRRMGRYKAQDFVEILYDETSSLRKRKHEKTEDCREKTKKSDEKNVRELSGKVGREYSKGPESSAGGERIKSADYPKNHDEQRGGNRISGDKGGNISGEKFGGQYFRRGDCGEAVGGNTAEKKRDASENAKNIYVSDGSEQSKQMDLLHQKIQASLAKHGLLSSTTAKQGLVDPNTSRPEVFMNEFGQTIDAKTGQPITFIQHTPTAKINLRAKRKLVARNARIELKVGAGKPLENSGLSEKSSGLSSTVSFEKTERGIGYTKEHYDPRIKETGSIRKARNLTFLEPGKIAQTAQTERTKIQFEKLQAKIQEIARRTGIDSATKLAMVTLKEEAQSSNRIPDMEWWDRAIFGDKNYQDFNLVQRSLKTISGSSNGKDSHTVNKSLDNLEYKDSRFDLSQELRNNKIQKMLEDFFIGITNLVEHPVPRLPPGEARKDSAIKIFLTKNEQRKIRTRRRIENEKEKQDKILLGLMPPPPPKVKMSNLMRVLGTEAVQDPTKVEAYVKSQIAARKTAHELANAARKLTPEQKTAKLLKKYTEDTSLGVHVSVYRIWDLTGRSKRYKIEQNAKQNHMTGCMIIHQDMNLVILEGGPNSQKRMKRLLLNRIHWSEDQIVLKNKKADGTNTAENRCVLVWEGVNGYHNFKKWKFKSMDSESLAQDFLKKHQSDQFWNLAYSFTIDS